MSAEELVDEINYCLKRVRQDHFQTQHRKNKNHW